MKKIFLDLEANFTIKKHPLKDETYTDYASPYNDNNRVVLSGYYIEGDGYYETNNPRSIPINDGDVLVGHNIKYDYQWLKECGANVSSVTLEDTMLREAIASCGKFGEGQPAMIALNKAAPRRGGTEKVDLVKKLYWDKGVNTSEVPPTILSRYQKGDVWNTYKLYEAQESDLEEQHSYLAFASDLLPVIADMELNGCKFNDEEHDDVLVHLQEEVAQAERTLWEELDNVCGDNLDDLLASFSPSDKATKIIDSSQQLSRIIYSLEVKPDKKIRKAFSAFSKSFKPLRAGAQKELDEAIALYCNKLPYGCNVKPKCSWMGGAQVTKGKYVGALGFSANSKLLEAYIDNGKPTKKALAFIEAMLEYSKKKTWLNTNYSGIIKGLRDDGYIHGGFNQCGTVTMRFSSSNPNMQNWPRGSTTPLKKLIKTRY